MQRRATYLLLPLASYTQPCLLRLTTSQTRESVMQNELLEAPQTREIRQRIHELMEPAATPAGQAVSRKHNAFFTKCHAFSVRFLWQNARVRDEQLLALAYSPLLAGKFSYLFKPVSKHTSLAAIASAVRVTQLDCHADCARCARQGIHPQGFCMRQTM